MRTIPMKVTSLITVSVITTVVMFLIVVILSVEVLAIPIEELEQHYNQSGANKVKIFKLVETPEQNTIQIQMDVVAKDTSTRQFLPPSNFWAKRSIKATAADLLRLACHYHDADLAKKKIEVTQFEPGFYYSNAKYRRWNASLTATAVCR